MKILAITIIAYLAVGIWLVTKTQSRGLRADLPFVMRISRVVLALAKRHLVSTGEK